MTTQSLNRLLLALSALAVLGVAAIGGWFLATLGGSGKAVTAKRDSETSESPSTSDASNKKPHPLEHLIGQDPVAHFKAAKTASERLDAISNFMALGDDLNYTMLKAALDDTDAEVRLYAVESASALEEEHAAEVWKKSATSPDPDVREMTWSLSATYPMDKRAAIYREALARGPLQAFEEAIEEMGVSPERPLFEMMLTIGTVLPQDRTPRLLEVVQEWLEPGGGEVPQFSSLADALKWWESQHENYDEFMLRTDQ